jgi:hypothetical protein
VKGIFVHRGSCLIRVHGAKKPHGSPYGAEFAIYQ